MRVNVSAISEQNVSVPSRLGKLTVTYENHAFYVIDSNGLKSAIQKANLDKELKNVSNEETLKKILNVGYLTLKKRGKDYTLQFNGRLPGGGPFSGITVFMGTWTTGLVMCAAGTVLTVTGVGASAGVALIAAGATTMTTIAPIAGAIAASTPTP